MRVIFLDIDGVLLSEASILYWYCEFKAGRAGKLGEHWDRKWCPVCTSNFRILLAELPIDVKIVVSSSWRIGIESVEQLKQIFYSRDVDSSRIIGQTSGDFNGVRGDQIQEYISRHEVTDCIILDDDSDMGILSAALVKTEFSVGLTLPIVRYIIAHFSTHPYKTDSKLSSS